MSKNMEVLRNALMLSSRAFGIPDSLSCSLRPIIVLNDSRVMGYQITFKNMNGIVPENETSSSDVKSVVALVKRQIAMLNMYTHVLGLGKVRFFVKIPPSILFENNFIAWLCSYSEVSISLEVSYHDLLIYRGVSTIEKIARLRAHGHELWLDTGKYTVSNYYEAMKLPEITWDGIRLDKSLLWDGCSDIERMKQIIAEHRTLSSNIIVDGIESWFQLFICKCAGVRFGQGFYWKSISL
jgi:EAL domain-containing protein (putative c-di-GMP-specific phosphodiesterase class I)